MCSESLNITSNPSQLDLWAHAIGAQMILFGSFPDSNYKAKYEFVSSVSITLIITLLKAT